MTDSWAEGVLARPQILGRNDPSVTRELVSTADRASSVLLEKIGLFMHYHVLPHYGAERIHWWLSVSGGKDSLAMAEGLRAWYALRRLRFNATVFVIDQWRGPAPSYVEDRLSWSRVVVLDASDLTMSLTSYRPGDQAPCRLCSDARHVVTDRLVFPEARRDKGRVHFIARALHLSDTAVSVLWRRAMGRPGEEELLAQGKARPLAQLTENVFLAKPLLYVREFETQSYAVASSFVPACCGCPACRYPSRRDIVEETVLQLFRGDLWELDIPGVRRFLVHVACESAVDHVERLSLRGTEQKHPHLGPEFFSFVEQKFRASLPAKLPAAILKELDTNTCLDDLGVASLRHGLPPNSHRAIPIPRLLTGRELDSIQQRLVTALGPFWGAFALSEPQRTTALRIQEKLLGLRIDERWSHVVDLIHNHGGKKHDDSQHSPEGLAVPVLPRSGVCVCGS